MTTERLVSLRAEELKRALRRHKLVFVHTGAIFEPIGSQIAQEASSELWDARGLADRPRSEEVFDTGNLGVTGLEWFTRLRPTGATLGDLRIVVDRALEAGANVCLFSRVPCCAFPAIPGSSLVEDSKTFHLQLLSKEEADELQLAERGPVDAFPAISIGRRDLKEVLRATLIELGVNVLAALDDAVFESGSRDDFLSFLDFRELEALRSAGLVGHIDGELSFLAAKRYSEFKEALGDVLAESVSAPNELGEISASVWTIERTIRRRVRAKSMVDHGSSWRKKVLHGDLGAKSFERARADTNVTAKSVAELRDPLEWLSLGELLEVVDKLGGVGGDTLFWRKFAQDIIPVRNRLSHMRLTRKGDYETVLMWASRIARLP